jgi:hypothetical protein
MLSETVSGTARASGCSMSAIAAKGRCSSRKRARRAVHPTQAGARLRSSAHRKTGIQSQPHRRGESSRL